MMLELLYFLVKADLTFDVKYLLTIENFLESFLHELRYLLINKIEFKSFLTNVFLCFFYI